MINALMTSPDSDGQHGCSQVAVNILEGVLRVKFHCKCGKLETVLIHMTEDMCRATESDRVAYIQAVFDQEVQSHEQEHKVQSHEQEHKVQSHEQEHKG